MARALSFPTLIWFPAACRIIYIYPWRALQISKDGDDQRILGGPKFLILGFLWDSKIWQVLLWGGLILGVFKTIRRFVVVPVYPSRTVRQIKYNQIKYCTKRYILGFDFCPNLTIPITWNPEYPPGYIYIDFEVRYPGEDNVNETASTLQWCHLTKTQIIIDNLAFCSQDLQVQGIFNP